MKSPTLWSSGRGDCVYVDRVIGKHEWITYAVGITREGKIKGLEILEYRESHGREVRESSWRGQFVGKDKTAPLKVGQDIRNMSGATLSSNHVTAGVRRLMRLHDLLKSRI